VPKPPKGLRVLIVDDEPMIANTLMQILNASGFEARAVYDGNEATHSAELWKPDVLLTDVMLRGISGVDVAVHVAEKLPACRVILFSGQASTADLLERASEKGHHFEILTKPLHPEILLRKLSARD
jgi:DNA-binding response OmpR family regulator